MRHEHHVKRPRFTKWISVRTLDVIFNHCRIHLFHRHPVWIHAVVFQDMIGPKSAMIHRVLTERINERIDMSARLPYFLIHQNGRIDAVHVIAAIHEVLPPQIHNITLQSHAQRTIVPRSSQAAIHIRPLINKPAPLRETYYFFHRIICIIHTIYCTTKRQIKRARRPHADGLRANNPQ